MSSRNSFFDYEIPILSPVNSKLIKIPLNDLYIKIFNGKILLFSKKLEKQIIPRFSNYYNHFLSNNSIFSFLVDIRSEMCSPNLLFEWGNIANKFDFLPRIKYDKVILAPARWKVKKEDFYEKDIEYIETWRKDKRIPELILISEGDNDLLIDFNSNISCYLFLEVINKKNVTLIKEFLSDNFKKDKSSKHKSELVAFILNENFKFKKGEFNKIEICQKSHSKFGLLNNWMYYKIYCSPESADKILKSMIFPLVNRLRKKNVIKTWFFIRYYDSDFHLRFRLKINEDNFDYLEFREDINNYLNSGLIKSIVLDNYKKELQRYGESNIKSCENIFCYDSLSFLNFLNKHYTIRDPDAKIFYAINSIYILFNGMYPSNYIF